MVSFISAETTFFEGDYFMSRSSAPIPSSDSGQVFTGVCSSLWVCEPWSSCSENVRIRDCVDISSCNSGESPPSLLSCSEPLPSDRINGCVDFVNLDLIISRWKLVRFDVVNEAIFKWRTNQC